MRRLGIRGVVFALLTILALTLSAVPIAAQDAGGEETDPSGVIQLTATINGLEEGDEATLSISPEGEMSGEAVIVSMTLMGEDKAQTVTLSADLDDGYYQLTIEAGNKYFREPQGYFFKVLDSKVLNPRDRDITFELIPPSARDYQPYRKGDTTSDIADEVPPPTPITGPEEPPYVAEAFISLSAPARNGIGKGIDIVIPEVSVPPASRSTTLQTVAFVTLLAVAVSVIGLGARYWWIRKRRA